ncbi:MAG TPA: Ig-like domain-containing protein [Gaiellaceae bacterium]
MGRVAALLLLLVAVVALAGSTSGAATRSPVLLPDMRLVVPTGLISIGLDGNGQRELRFTHITADLGPGEFEIDPRYNANTGVSTFTQALHRRNGSIAKRLHLGTYGTWEPPDDYRYPLSSFTLNEVGPNDSVGAVVARSLKVDYCMTGDVQVPGYPNPPSSTAIPNSNCADPTRPLGWSAGWGDEYDQTDAGQPISLAGLPADGTYVLRATVDPQHVLHEVTTADDVTDTKLTITGNDVTIDWQKVTKVPLPRVRVAVGAASLTATVSPPAGKTVESLQFVVDGHPIGPVQTSAPYTYPLPARPGTHFVSARVTDTDGVMGSAPVRTIVVPKTPAVHVTRLTWSAGLLQLRLKARAGVAVTAVVRGHRHRVGARGLDLRVPRPTRVTLILSSGRSVSRLVLPLDSHPAVQLVNPGANETVTGIVPVAADATDSVGVTAVRLSVDGKPIGSALRSPPFHLVWDTRKLSDGPHVLAARVKSATGASTVTRETVNVSNPAPRMTCFVLQHQENVRGQSQVTTDSFQTVVPGETLLALVSADGPQVGRQSAVVSGGGLDWTLASRANARPGDAEVWEAIATTATTISPITAVLKAGGYDGSLTIVAEEAADGVGAKAHASGPSGAPHLTLTTLAATSLVFAVGNDWDRAAKRTLPVGWAMLDQWLNTGTGDTFWSQYTNATTGKAGTHVSVRDTKPTNDRWNLAAVELVSSGD